MSLRGLFNCGGEDVPYMKLTLTANLGGQESRRGSPHFRPRDWRVEWLLEVSGRAVIKFQALVNCSSHQDLE